MLKNIKLLREETGISQQTLANAIGVSQQSINKYENHNIEPDIDTLIRMADYFATSVDFLVGHTNVRLKVESMHFHELNETECEVIRLYRKLSPRQKACVNMVMSCF